MARPCTVCTHPNLAEIDEALVMGHSHRAVATAHGLGRWAVLRHRKNHISPAMRTRIAEREGAREETLVDRLEELYDRVEGILDVAEEEGRPLPGLLAAREMRKCIELLGRFLGQLDGNALTVNGPVTWQIVQYGLGPGPDAILRALEPWPEAQAAVRGLLAPAGPAALPVSAPVPTSARAVTTAEPRPVPLAASPVPPPALAPPAMAATDRELLREAEARRRAEALTQQATAPTRPPRP